MSRFLHLCAGGGIFYIRKKASVMFPALLEDSITDAFAFFIFVQPA